MKPGVSIILPVYNRLAFLAATVDRVFAQTRSDWELVVADDGSDEETRAWLARLAADPRVRVVRLAHSGNPAVARNAALREARGEFVAFLDSDDLWLPQKLEVQLRELVARPDCRWSYCAFVRIDARGAPLADEPVRAWRPLDGEIFAHILDGSASLRTPCVVAARALVAEAGGFDESLRDCEDLDLWLRLALRSPVVLVDEPLVHVRIAAGSITSHPRHARADLVRVLAKHASLSPARWRGTVRRERARQEMLLANEYAAHGAHARMWRTLADAMPHAWPYPFAWGHAMHALLRSLAARFE